MFVPFERIKYVRYKLGWWLVYLERMTIHSRSC